MLLVVERDDRFVAKLKKHLAIKGLKNFFVATTTDALQQIKALRASFLLIDINSVTAIDEVKALKNYAKTRHIPLLFISGHQRTQTLEKRLQQKGHGDFIKLPFRVSELQHRIESMRRDTDPFLGTKLGPPGQEVEITRKLGSGAMGTVYEACQGALDRRVAVKFLSDRIKNDSEEEALRFQKEARAMAKLRSPNIAQIFFAGKHAGRAYMVMEFIEGPNLDKYLGAKGRLTAREALSIGLDVLSGLDQAHKHGQIHRDIKPANIMLNRDNQAVLLDFGLVRGEGDEAVTQAGTVLGTPLYMSPEQVRGDGLDHRTDLYSLGIILFELLLGEAPYQGKDFYAILMKHLNDPLPPPEKFGMTMHPAVWAIIVRLTEKNLAQRYQSAAQVIVDVGQVLDGYDAEALNDASSVVPVEADALDGELAGMAVNQSGSAIARFGTLPPGRDTMLSVFNGLIQSFQELEVLGDFERGYSQTEDGETVVFPYHEGLAFIHSSDARASEQFDRCSAADLAQYFELGRRR